MTTHFKLDLAGNDLTLMRGDTVVLRGQLGPGARVQADENGWRVEHAPAGAPVEDVFDLRTSGHWFGGQELINQIWPLDRAMLNAGPFFTWDNGPDGLSGILTPLWLASSGVALLADDDQELNLSVNRTTGGLPANTWNLAFPTVFDRRPPPDDGTGEGVLRLGGPGLRYRILAGANPVEAWRACLPHLGRPPALPPERLWKRPIWTTWARYKMDISQDRVIEFADEIAAHGYPYGIIEIDDRWQTHYGDIAFDPARFPDPRRMVEELHARGFTVTCWAIPFINPEADNLAVAQDRGYLLKQEDGSPQPVGWWQGSGFMIDSSNPQAMDWFGGNLRALQEAVGLDGWKFDAGEAIFARGRNEYTRRYVDYIAAHFPFCEVRSGWGNQHSPILFRQWDKSCRWGTDNGLQSVITGALALSLAGYPFILPDMVGGNAYGGENADAELMIRWTQASALFPAIQFSLAPWEYGEECDRLCREALALRERYLGRIEAALQSAVQTGDPAIRPVWWLEPGDERALVCADQFVLGDDLIVAPVVEPGARHRPVYLPHGAWREAHSGRELVGPAVLDVPAPLDALPLYEKAG